MKLSVCIPVYNAARYIEPCARSLFAQTYADVEYVFVDDCSSDGSVDILRRVMADYPGRQSGVRIIRNDRNRGPVGSRKVAIREATGDVLAFCDADDWVDDTLYARLMDRMREAHADVVLCSFVRQAEGGRRFVVERDDRRLMRGEEAMAQVDSIPALCSMCTKIVRRNLLDLDAIEWPESIRIAEDHCLTMQVLSRCAVVAGVRGVYYHYRLAPTSLTHAWDARRLVADHARVYDILTRRIPDKAIASEQRYLARTVLYWGTTHGLLSRREFKHWRKVFEDLGGTWDWHGQSLWGQRMMRVVNHSYYASRLVAPLVKHFVRDEL